MISIVSETDTKQIVKDFKQKLNHQFVDFLAGIDPKENFDLWECAFFATTQIEFSEAACNFLAFNSDGIVRFSQWKQTNEITQLILSINFKSEFEEEQTLLFGIEFKENQCYFSVSEYMSTELNEYDCFYWNYLHKITFNWINIVMCLANLILINCALLGFLSNSEGYNLIVGSIFLITSFVGSFNIRRDKATLNYYNNDSIIEQEEQ